MGAEPEELSKVFGAATTPTATLALKAAVDVDLDVLFDQAAAASPHRTGAILRPMERRSLEGTSRQLSMPSRVGSESRPSVPHSGIRCARRTLAARGAVDFLRLRSGRAARN
jgi:hypothetical protein